MNDELILLKKMLPEAIELLEKRYDILNAIKYYQPIGRRLLSEKLNIGERYVRNEVEVLKEIGLLKVTENGMYLTHEAQDIIEKISHIVYDIKGLNDVQKKVRDILGAKEVYIVPGDADKNPIVLKEIGKIASNIIINLLNDVKIVALTGGTTVKEVVDSFPRVNYKDILVVPARGGIGQEVEKQANTLAANLAIKIGGKYKLLHFPDNVDKDMYDIVIKKKEILDIINDINNAQLLVYGIGSAIEMARRRNFDEMLINKLKKVGAIGEIFGYYFDKNKNIVFSTTTIGIRYESLNNIKYLIGVAGGKHKAEAMLSLGEICKKSIFVIDEGIAYEILNIHS